jgi:hypothetical protein
MEKTMEGMERKMEGMERRKEGWRKCYSRLTKLSAAHAPMLPLWRQPQRTMIRIRLLGRFRKTIQYTESEYYNHAGWSWGWTKNWQVLLLVWQQSLWNLAYTFSRISTYAY